MDDFVADGAFLRLACLAGVLSCAPSRQPITVEDICSTDAWHQTKKLASLNPEEARAYFDLLEKWATVGRRSEGVARLAMHKIAESGHPRAAEVLLGLRDSVWRANVLANLKDLRDQEGVCDAIAAEWIRLPDPVYTADETRGLKAEEQLERALVEPFHPCASHLRPYAAAHWDRVRPIFKKVGLEKP